MKLVAIDMRYLERPLARSKKRPLAFSHVMLGYARNLVGSRWLELKLSYSGIMQSDPVAVFEVAWASSAIEEF